MTTNDLRRTLLLIGRQVELVENATDDLRKQFALPLGQPNLTLSETSGDCLGGEVRAPFAFLRFKISQPPDRFAGPVDTEVFYSSIGIADQGSDSPVLKMRSTRKPRPPFRSRRMEVLFSSSSSSSSSSS
jgi:hypothetical protein